MTTFDLLRADARRLLTEWQPAEPAQQVLRDEYLAFLTEHAMAMSRECRIGHLTSSVLMMDEARTRVLLTLHPKVGRWLQLGGHNEIGDASVRDAAQREAIEESGIATVSVSRHPMRLDRHPVPCGGEMSEHLDVQFLGVVPSDARESMSEESDDLRWFPVAELPASLDDSVQALIRSALEATP